MMYKFSEIINNREQDETEEKEPKCTQSPFMFILWYSVSLYCLDSKEELEEFDSDWAQTHRAKAISEERDKRQNSRERAKTGGYLDFLNDPDSDNQEEAHEDLPDPNDQVSRIDYYNKYKNPMLYWINVWIHNFKTTN